MKHTLLSVPAIAALALTVPVYGKEAPAKLEEIIVRGDKLERTKLDIATSVAMLDAETLEQSTIDDIYEAFARIANVNVDFGKHGGSGGFVIRGISNTGLQQNTGTNAPLATTYVDEVPLARSAVRAPLDFWDMESMEVFRGPQSTNQGKNALAGAIHLRTRDPHEEFSGRMRSRGGTDDYRQLAAALNVPLLAGFKFRVASRLEEGDGEVENTTTGESASYFDNETHRAKLAWSLDELPVSAILSHTQNESIQGQPQLVQPYYRRESTANDREELQLDTNLTSQIVDWQTADWLDIKLITAASDSIQRQFDDYNGDERDDGIILNNADDDTASQELRFTFNNIFLGRLGEVRGVVGLYASQYDSAGNFAVIDGGVVDGILLNGKSSYDESTSNEALFSEFDWNFLERWTLTLGFRHDRESLDFSYATEFDLSFAGVPTPAAANDFLSDIVGPQVGLPPDSRGSSAGDFSAFLPKVALAYGTDNWRVGILAQEAYRTGGVSANLSRGTFVEFDPEYTETIELVWRSESFEQRLSTAINLYYTDWVDQQVPVQLSQDPNDIQTENAGTSVVYGFELESEYRPTDHWRLFAAWGQSFTEFKKFDSSAGDLSGNVFPNAPRHSGSVGLSFEDNHGFYAQLDATYTQGSFRLPNNQKEQRSDSRLIFNGRAGYRSDRFEVYVIDRNMADKRYLTQRSFGDYAIAGAGRTIEIGIELTLGE